ncbi:hypothetical protein [Thalassiella azotivora]
MSRHLTPAAGLFVLAPLVAEFLLGNLPLTMLPALVTLAPLYGGGALLVRELSRRRDSGWPGILLLGVAFGLVQEAFVTRTLTDRDYAGLGLLEIAHVPALGVGAWWTVFVLVVHAVWSVALPVALVESLSSPPRDAAWLGRSGVVSCAVVTLLGGVGASAFAEAGRAPSGPQSAAVLAVAGGLAVVGLRRRATPTRPLARGGGRAPAPVLVGLLALTAGSVFWASAAALDDVVRLVGEWGTVALYVLLPSTAAVAVVRWSRRPGWGDRHVLALAAAGVLTYVWHSFVQPSAVPVDPRVDLVGDVVLAVAALVLVGLAATRSGMPSDRATRRGSAGPGADQREGVQREDELDRYLEVPGDAKR